MGQCSSLTVKLEHAIARLDGGAPGPPPTSWSLRREVDGDVNGHIQSSEQGQSVIDLAMRLLASMGQERQYVCTTDGAGAPTRWPERRKEDRLDQAPFGAYGWAGARYLLPSSAPPMSPLRDLGRAGHRPGCPTRQVDGLPRGPLPGYR
jgi:hypothetical protein